MTFIKRISLSALLFATMATASGGNKTMQASFVIRQSAIPEAEWLLEAEQADLHGLLRSLSERSAIKIHYAALPTVKVDATCIGPTVVRILRCLLGAEANMLFHYAESVGDDANKQEREPKEIWIIASSLSPPPIASARPSDCRSSEAKGISRPVEGLDNALSVEQDVDSLLRQVDSEDPEKRMNALAGLARLGKTDSPEVYDAVARSISDTDARVRGQAVYALSQIENDPNALNDYLQQALQDAELGVRLMTIDAIEPDSALLQQALQDTDSSVRDYAASKLQAIMQR
ncbi:HEAT repeat domain-containing protein [Methylotuvimicrobium sp. KM1]|uniref:HEAT repeat domain-containing protein n=1 Tax=Methylotuvimicrobium sp. KM1 TaxID=3377707 RepID=UPI00384A4CE8